MFQLPWIDLTNYQYELPEECIAKYPLNERDLSKLLVWKSGKIMHSQFKQLADFLPVNATLFFNNTKVIPARLLFEKSTGGIIEVFLLNPAEDRTSIGEALVGHSPATWKCTVGNAKRWPDSLKLTKSTDGLHLTAQWANRKDGFVKFTWTPADTPFARMVEAAGAVPLPPYLNRAAEELDKARYQTVYSKHEGAVAAPTAGLHFTPAVLDELTRRGIQSEYLTLHVSAGTFLPIKSENAAEHRMHVEEIAVRKHNIVKLLEPGRQVIAVGTTALRTLESLYWFGVKLAKDPEASFSIPQHLPYEGTHNAISIEQSLELVLKRMEHLGLDELVGHTAIYVMPGYQFRVTQGLITNFHQPCSSLLVLVSALVGSQWKNIYREALKDRYRFLSYGDSSLLLP